jgi:ribonuclease III
LSPSLDDLETRLGHAFADRSRLSVALTHRSASGRVGENNEKLEFLGDAVLNLAISDLLMERFAEMREGDLSKVRASVVNGAVLATKAAALDLGRELRLGRGEERSGGREKESILSSAYEAVLGAVFLDAGFAAARRLVARDFARELDEGTARDFADPKTRLQELTQRRFKAPPVYALIRSSGPDHAKAFEVEIRLEERVLGRGEGRSKKAAEQEAALRALELLDEPRPADTAGAQEPGALPSAARSPSR